MSGSKMGWNVHNQQNNDLIGWLQEKKPPYICLVSPGPTTQVSTARRILAECPDTEIIYRIWRYDDGGRPDAGFFGAITHEQFWRAHQPLIDEFGDRIIYHSWNEANSDDNIADYIEWETRLVHEANARGLRVCVANFLTGTPQPYHWALVGPLVGAIGSPAGSWGSILGIHEYVFQDDTWQEGKDWHVGRYRHMVNAISDSGVDVSGLKIVVTELGFDGGVGKQLGEYDKSANYVIDQIMSMHTDMYNGDPHIAGTCWYSWGDWGGWRDHNLNNFTAVRNAVFDLSAPYSPGGDPPVPNPCADPIPEVDATFAGLYVVQVDDLNVRPYPNTVDHPCCEPVLTVNTGDRIQVSGHITANGYVWAVTPSGAFVAMSAGDTIFLEKAEEDDFLLVFKTNNPQARDMLHALAHLVGGELHDKTGAPNPTGATDEAVAE